MCKYCDFYVKAADFAPYTEIMQVRTKFVDGMVDQVTEVYIGDGDKDGVPALKLMHSYELRNFEGTDEVEKVVPITYCPFCGVKLAEAREKYEKEHVDD